jgi:hypothetical protein
LIPKKATANQPGKLVKPSPLSSGKRYDVSTTKAQKNAAPGDPGDL